MIYGGFRMASFSNSYHIKETNEKSSKQLNEAELILLHTIEESINYLLIAPGKSFDKLPMLNIFNGNA